MIEIYTSNANIYVKLRGKFKLEYRLLRGNLKNLNVFRLLRSKLPQTEQLRLKQIANTWIQNANISRVIKSTSNYESWKLHKFLVRYRVFKQDAPLTRGSIVKTHSLCNFNACTPFLSHSLQPLHWICKFNYQSSFRCHCA